MIKFFSMCIILSIFSLFLVSCSSADRQLRELRDEQADTIQQLEELETEINKLEEEEKAKAEEELLNLLPDKNYIVIDKRINTEVLRVLYDHFDAISKHDEEKYNNTLLNPENTNSTWTWRLANDTGVTFEIHQLRDSFDEGKRVFFTCVFRVLDGKEEKTMSPQFMFTKTEDGWKIYDID